MRLRIHFGKYVTHHSRSHFGDSPRRSHFIKVGTETHKHVDICSTAGPAVTPSTHKVDIISVVNVAMQRHALIQGHTRGRGCPGFLGRVRGRGRIFPEPLGRGAGAGDPYLARAEGQTLGPRYRVSAASPVSEHYTFPDASKRLKTWR